MVSNWPFVSCRNLSNPEPLTISGLRDIFNRLEKECGIHCNPHKFRRSFATTWLDNSGGEDIEILMIVGGWEDFKTVKEHYAHIKTTLLFVPLAGSSENIKKESCVMEAPLIPRLGIPPALLFRTFSLLQAKSFLTILLSEKIFQKKTKLNID
jgi:hypothetical protein